jgi:flagellar hook-length control protein FliK
VPDSQIDASAAPAMAAAAGPPVAGNRVDAAAAEPVVDGVETPSGSTTTDGSEATADSHAAAPDALPVAEKSPLPVQPNAVNPPAPRSDATIADVAEGAPTPPSPTPDATPTQQVAEALREVRRLADGSHRLSLQLHPEELGAVHLEVALRDGRLHVRAVAETEAARSALERNLPELRSDLRDAGIRAGSLEVGPDASGRDRSDTPSREAFPEVRRGNHVDALPTSIPDPTASSGLDIRL